VISEQVTPTQAEREFLRAEIKFILENFRTQLLEELQKPQFQDRVDIKDFISAVQNLPGMEIIENLVNQIISRFFKTQTKQIAILLILNFNTRKINLQATSIEDAADRCRMAQPFEICKFATMSLPQVKPEKTPLGDLSQERLTDEQRKTFTDDVKRVLTDLKSRLIERIRSFYTRFATPELIEILNELDSDELVNNLVRAIEGRFLVSVPTPLGIVVIVDFPARQVCLEVMPPEAAEKRCREARFRAEEELCEFNTVTLPAFIPPATTAGQSVAQLSGVKTGNDILLALGMISCYYILGKIFSGGTKDVSKTE
jgi:hypothetical protein